MPAPRLHSARLAWLRAVFQQLRPSIRSFHLSQKALKAPSSHSRYASFSSRAQALSAAAPASLSKPGESPIVLRPYQRQCLDDCLHAISSGTYRIGASLPTGAGKTTVFSELIHELPAKHVEGRAAATQSLVLVGTVELARQAAERIKHMHPHLSVEIEQGAANVASGRADVTVATYQTLTTGSGQRMAKFDPDSFKLLVVDEAHHVASASYLRIVDYFAKRSPNQTHHSSTLPIVGFSATFSRHDGLALSAVFDHIVYHKDFLEMIHENWLCPVRFTTVQVDMKLSNVSVSKVTGDFVSKSLSHAICEGSVTDAIVHAWKTKAAERRSTLVFAVDVAHAEQLASAFDAAGISCKTLVGTTPTQQRLQLLQDFRDGRFQVLVNCAILTEGADVPAIDCVLMARPTMSKNLFSQMIGRGLRHSPETNKEDCLILDVVGSATRDIICSPTLFGLDPRKPLENAPVDELVREKAEGTESGSLQPQEYSDPGISEKDLEYRDFTVEDLMSHGPVKSQDIIAISQLAWVSCGRGIFVLELMGKGYIRVEAEGENGWMAKFVRKAPTGRNKFFSPQPITQIAEPDFSRCIRMCDAYALGSSSSTPEPSKSTPRSLLLRAAPWRKALATEAQRDFLQKSLKDRLDSFLRLANGGKAVALEDLTKGQAGNAMTMLRHGGAKSRMDKHERSEGVRIRKTQRVMDRQAKRQPVRVGPLR